jgi:hypothetical protein
LFFFRTYPTRIMPCALPTVTEFLRALSQSLPTVCLDTVAAAHYHFLLDLFRVITHNYFVLSNAVTLLCLGELR